MIAAESTASSTASDRDHSSRSRMDGDATDEDLGLMAAGDEQRYLTSANMCRWVIDFADVQLGAQVGVGSYGVVYRAAGRASTWPSSALSASNSTSGPCSTSAPRSPSCSDSTTPTSWCLSAHVCTGPTCAW
ncbi:ser/thr kinase [Pandoravirus inopinatum]|uniref:Ser/thr kinase n=1 Tax=Pandoravirus inopinatum TaxID=1605721 RepID=A0A0B5J796_9VIRU|nr:ser/thr kinase [Pandoravirus inopinatum]AJF97700.1 ser/thr kinase [Pandoravirus inopinatum]